MGFLPTDPGRRVEVTLPELGANLLEAVVVAWEKHPGDWIEQDETICIVSADGLRAGVASWASGYMVRRLAGVGARIGPGTSLAEIAMPVADDEPRPPEPLEPPQVESPPGSPPQPRVRTEDVLAYLGRRDEPPGHRSIGEDTHGARTTLR